MYLTEVTQIVVGCIVVGVVLGIVARFVLALIQEATEESLRLTEEQEFKLQQMRQETELVQEKLERLQSHQQHGHEPYGANGPFKQRGAVDLSMVLWLLGIGVVLAAIGVIREFKFNPSLRATMCTIVAAVLFIGSAVGFFIAWAATELLRLGGVV